jgi:hypothetical protein
VIYSEKKVQGKGSPGNIRLVFGINVIVRLPDQMMMPEMPKIVMKLLLSKSWQDEKAVL